MDAWVDGLMTNEPGLMLGIHTADCAPVYLVDPVRRAIALLHSGQEKHRSRHHAAHRAADGRELMAPSPRTSSCRSARASGLRFLRWISPP